MNSQLVTGLFCPGDICFLENPSYHSLECALNITYLFVSDRDLLDGTADFASWAVLTNAASTELPAKCRYDNTLVFLTSDNGGAIYAGTANNNFPLRGGKFNNFDGGQRVNALFSGGWIEGALNHYDLKAFYSETVMAMNDVPETLLQMVTGRPYPDGGMRNKPGPLSGIPLWDKILQKRQVPRRITYSETMEIKVGPNIADLRKIWFTENNTIIADGNWSTNFPTNIEFIPDLAYLYVRPCGEPYCHFDLYSDSGEQSNIILSPAQEQRMRQDVFDAWNDNILDSARIKSLNGSNGLPFQVALWTYYGNSGPFVNLDAEPISVPAQCWCDWIDDGVAPEEVTHMIINLYLGIRCTNTIKAFGIAGALACERPLSLTQAPINFSLQENMWKTIGYETSNFSSILTAQWNEGPVELLFPLPLLEWNFAAIHGLQTLGPNKIDYLHIAPLLYKKREPLSEAVGKGTHPST